MRKNAYNTSDRLRGKRAILILGVLCVIILLVLCFSHSRFTTNKWKDRPEKREAIISDLLNRYSLIGMSEEEVILLLGNEDVRGSNQTSFKGDTSYYPADSTLVYYLGKEYVDDKWLILSISEGIVSKISYGIT